MEKKNHEILVALQYKPLYNISRSEKWGKKNTSRGQANNGARTVSYFSNSVGSFFFLCQYDSQN